MGVGKKIIRGFISLSSAEIISKVLGFLATVYLARILGPFHFGVISFALALLTYFSAGSHLGLDKLGARMIARNNDEVKTYFQQIFLLKLVLALFFFLFLLGLICIIDRSPSEKTVLLLFSLTIFPTALLIEWVFQGLEKFNWIGISRIVANLFYFFAVILFIRGTNNLYLVPVFKFISTILSALFLFIVFYLSFGFVIPKIDFSIWKRLLLRAWPLGLYSIMVIIIANLDMVMIGFMRTNEEIGYYNAAYRFIWMLLVLLGAYLHIVYPTFSYFYKNSVKSLQRVALRSSKLVLTIIIPIAVGGSILASRLIFHVFGDVYLNGTLALQILLWTVIFISVNSLMVYVLLAANRETDCLKVVAFQAVVNIFFNFLFIPRYGIYGAAWATLIAEFLGIYFYFRFLKPIFQFNFLPHVYRPLISSGTMGLILYSLNLKIYFSIPLGIMVYFTALIILGGISRKEINSMFGYVFKNT